jgi:hypothetical protein
MANSGSGSLPPTLVGTAPVEMSTMLFDASYPRNMRSWHQSAFVGVYPDERQPQGLCVYTLKGWGKKRIGWIVRIDFASIWLWTVMESRDPRSSLPAAKLNDIHLQVQYPATSDPNYVDTLMLDGRNLGEVYQWIRRSAGDKYLPFEG